ncbi:ABC transporter substrate-binding protein [Salinibacterium sp. PAMC 21357]|uniref:ABC transporter substrate-binding protein n=1 Tax=Salinibacterium sp. PAMC 21357 TaxID=1112215 RepID=UPI00028985E9|nr:ABC transporter substrate-binding protein [Salinibacterium sp. PAMC 21357]
MSFDLTRRSLLTVGMGGLTLAALAACSGGGNTGALPKPGETPTFGGSLRMSQYGTAERKARLDKMFALYTKQFGGEVKVSAVESASYGEKLATEMAGGAAADIVPMYQSLVAEYARKDLLADLDGWPTITDVSGLDQVSITSGVIDGKRTALPLGDNSYAAFYDRTRLKQLGFEPPEPGDSWEDFIRFSNDVSTKSGGSYFGTMDAGADMNLFEVFLRQRGVSLYDGSALGFTAADAEAWLGMWEDLRKSGAAPSADRTAEAAIGGYGTTQLVTGQASNFFIFGNVFKAFSDLTASELAITSPPMPSASDSGLYVRASNWAAAYARGKNVGDAVNVIQFMLNDPEAVETLGTEFGAPPNLDLRASLTYDAADQAFVDYLDLVASDFAQPIADLAATFPAGATKSGQALKTVSETVAFGDQSVVDGAASLVAQMEGFLK